MTATIFPAVVYFLCFVTSSACAWLLGRSFRKVHARVLLWSAICFMLLALNNVVLVLDLVLLPDMDLRLPRGFIALAAVGVLLFGFVWDLEER